MITRAEVALGIVNDLSQGRRRWTMSVPAQPFYDPDLVLSASISEMRDVLRALAAPVPDPLKEALAALEGLRALIIGETGASTYECVDGERADAAIATLRAALVPAEAPAPLKERRLVMVNTAVDESDWRLVCRNRPNEPTVELEVNPLLMALRINVGGEVVVVSIKKAHETLARSGGTAPQDKTND